jgi:hypothetical protein
MRAWISVLRERHPNVTWVPRLDASTQNLLAAAPDAAIASIRDDRMLTQAV